MKKIKNALVINPFDSKPMQVTYDFQKTADGKLKRDESNEPIPIRMDLSTALAIRTFISGGFDPKDTTLTDSHSALRILDVLRPFKLLEAALGFKAPEHISLEDAEYDWLIKNVKERGPKMYGILAEIYVNAFEDVEKVAEPHKLEELDEPSNGSAKPKLVKNRV